MLRPLVKKESSFSSGFLRAVMREVLTIYYFTIFVYDRAPFFGLDEVMHVCS